MKSHHAKGLIGRIQHFMGSYRGKVILNYAYSWGAAIVILGALFKLTHVPGANLMLWIGMGTEVVVFFISAFDLPVWSGEGRENPPSPPCINSDAGKSNPDLEDATTNYLNQLKETTESLSKLNAIYARLLDAMNTKGK